MKFFSLVLAVLLTAATAFGYVVMTMSDYEISLAPGESDSVTANIYANEAHDMSIDCAVGKYDSDNNFVGNVQNGAAACGGPGEFIVTFDDGSVSKNSFAGDHQETVLISLGSDAEVGDTYKYTTRAGNSFSTAFVTADVNAVPEFTAIGAGIVLIGAGIAYFRLRK